MGIPDGAVNTLRSTVATKIKSYKRLVKVFGKLDRDGSGTLSRAEFRQLLEGGAGQHARGNVVPRGVGGGVGAAAAR